MHLIENISTATLLNVYNIDDFESEKIRQINVILSQRCYDYVNKIYPLIKIVK